MKHENINSVQQKQFWKCVNWLIMKTLLFVEYQMDVVSLIINNCDVCATRIPIILTYDKFKKKKKTLLESCESQGLKWTGMTPNGIPDHSVNE